MIDCDGKGHLFSASIGLTMLLIHDWFKQWRQRPPTFSQIPRWLHAVSLGSTVSNSNSIQITYPQSLFHDVFASKLTEQQTPKLKGEGSWDTRDTLKNISNLHGQIHPSQQFITTLKWENCSYTIVLVGACPLWLIGVLRYATRANWLLLGPLSTNWSYWTRQACHACAVGAVSLIMYTSSCLKLSSQLHQIFQ